MGITISEDAVRDGMEEFAARGNMNAEQMIEALAQAGVSEQSFAEFVRAGITWREVTGARFAGRVSVSEDEIDRATRALSGGSAVRVLLSEIILPVNSVEDAEAKQQLAARIATATARAPSPASPASIRRPRRRGAAGGWLAGGVGAAAGAAAGGAWPRARRGVGSAAHRRRAGAHLHARHPGGRGARAGIFGHRIRRLLHPRRAQRSRRWRAAKVRARSIPATTSTVWPRASRPRFLNAAPRPPRTSPPISPPSWPGSIPAKARPAHPRGWADAGFPDALRPHAQAR